MRAPVVNGSVEIPVTLRKKQAREEVREFLRRIGVKDVDEEDYIQALLVQHYRPGSRVADMKTHL